MFVRVKTKAENRWQVQIVESVQVGRKIQQKIVRNIGVAHDQIEIDQLRRLGEALIVKFMNDRQPVLGFADPADIYAPKSRVKHIDPEEKSIKLKNIEEEKRFNQGFEEFCTPLFKEFEIDGILGIDSVKNKEASDILKSLILARLFKPQSKRQSQLTLTKDFDVDIDLHKIYRLMDRVAGEEERIKSLVCRKTLDLFNQEVEVLFFDVTTLYFESFTPDELRNFGFSKDCKFKETQVVLALVTTKEGLPITYELFPGNTFEGSTLVKVVESLKERFGQAKITLVADRGMFSNVNLQALEEAGVSYIVAAKLKSMPKAVKSSILDDDYRLQAVEKDLQWLKEIALEERRLIASYSTKRAKKDRSDRQRLIDRLMKKVKNNKIKVKDLIPNYGSKKYIKVINDNAELNQSKIAQDALWDGMHGVITNIKDQSAETILSRYRGLWSIEEAFRVNKFTLKMRPIYHWNPKRIKAHIAICYLTYAILKTMQYRVKQAEINISLNGLLEELQRVQASIWRDKETNARFLVPSKLSDKMVQIYKVFGINRNSSTRLLT